MSLCTPLFNFGLETFVVQYIYPLYTIEIYACPLACIIWILYMLATRIINHNKENKNMT